MGFFGGLDVKESACRAGDLGSIPGSRRSPGERNGNPLQYSCLENSMDTTVHEVHGVTNEQLTLSNELIMGAWEDNNEGGKKRLG